MDGEDHQGEKALAETLPIPSRAVSLVEHPCVVKNVDKGIASLGGAPKLSKALRSAQDTDRDDVHEDEPEGVVSVSLRPDDPLAKRLPVVPVKTDNILLRVTVPKRTGRRRKRGTTGPFVTAEDIGNVSDGETASQNSAKTKTSLVDATTIYQSLAGRPRDYKVSLIGVIDETYRFRKLPDVQWAASQDETMRNIKDSLLPLRFRDMQNFGFNPAAGAQLSKHIGPSSEFMQMPVAYSYQYQQNFFVRYTKDKEQTNIGHRLVRHGYYFIRPTAGSVPTGPRPNLPPENTLTPALQSIIASIRGELAKRPIITRHLLYNTLGWEKRDRIREASVYCGYFFETGPWREALIVWGLDPRKDPAYRKYQTVAFLSYARKETRFRSKVLTHQIKDLAQKSAEELRREHMFDGINVSSTGNLFQICDIIDPLLRRILDTADLRTTCAPTFQGWYHIGTWAKANIILKDKMDQLIDGKTPDNSLYARIVAWPELWKDEDVRATYIRETLRKPKDHQHRHEWELMRMVRAAVRNPRYAFERMEARHANANTNPNADDEEMALSDSEVPEDLTEEPDRADAGEEDTVPEQTTAQDYSEESEAEEDDDGEGEDEEDDLRDLANDEDSDSDGPEDVADTDGVRIVHGPRPFGGLFR